MFWRCKRTCLDSSRFAHACTLWSAQKERPLADLLVDQGWLTPEDRADVERLLERKLKKHLGSVRASLAEVVTHELRSSLAGVSDSILQQSLAEAGTADGPVVQPTIAYEPQSRDRYTLMRLYATGGIGQVWLACDADLGREVALKELRPEQCGKPTATARFLEEARITGQLEHPGIVPVYELARRSTDGQPFYTMRFVKGRTLREASEAYHRKRKAAQAGPLDLRELLGTFVAVCQTVAYAHARGVLHRDLKGQNVMLGDYGEVILLDWGLAKLMRQADEATPPVVLGQDSGHGETVQGQILGTPAYMAPEQAEGRNDLVNTVSDVYGLGAILYEILTGHAPFSGVDTTEVLRRVLHEPPVPPRERVVATPAALEAICLKALAKKPTERYESASALAREVQRFLADEPVQAYPEPPRLRLARWGRRHKTLVASAAILLFAVTATLTAGTILLGQANRLVQEQRDQAEQQRDLAQQSFQTARRAVDKILNLVSEDQLIRQPSLQPLRDKLLKSTLEYYQAFLQQRRDDPAVRRELADAYARVGTIINETGSRIEARKALETAVEVLEELQRDLPDDLDVQSGRARSYLTLTYLQVFGGQQAEAQITARRAIALLTQMRAARPQVSEYGRLLGRCYDLLACSCVYQGHPQDAAQFSHQAITTLEQTVRAAPADAEARRLLALAHNNLSAAYGDLGDKRAEAQALRRAVVLYRQLVAESPSNTTFRIDLSRSLRNLGQLLHGIGHLAPARDVLEEAHTVGEDLVRQDPGVTLSQQVLAVAAGRLGEVLAAQGRTVRATRVLERSLQLFENLRAKNPLDSRDVDNYAWFIHLLATVQDERGHVEMGLANARRASKLLRQLVHDYPNNLDQKDDLLTVQQYLERLQSKATGSSVASQVAAQRAIIQQREELLRKEPGNQEWMRELAENELTLADLLLQTGARPEAALAVQKAFGLLVKGLQTQPDDYAVQRIQARAYTVQAGLQSQAADKAAAARSARQAVALLEKLVRQEPAYYYDLACAYALPSTLVQPEKTPKAPEDAARGVTALRQAIQAGYDNLAKLRTDPRLASLRARNDFQKLLRQLETDSRSSNSDNKQ